jgi:hypothetical protein
MKYSEMELDRDLWGLQAFQDSRIHLPRRKEEWPDQEALEERYDRFRAAI